jgi:hypothetical protein
MDYRENDGSTSQEMHSPVRALKIATVCTKSFCLPNPVLAMSNLSGRRTYPSENLRLMQIGCKPFGFFGNVNKTILDGVADCVRRMILSIVGL